MINITVWNEKYAKDESKDILEVYPNGLGIAVAEVFKGGDFKVKNVYLDDPENGLSDEVLKNTDVLVWWGHVRHGEVASDTVERIAKRVYEGMGAMFLHSSHFSKPFIKLMGTTCALGAWREVGEKERVWITKPAHPIAKGIENGFTIEHEEMYGESFDIPTPDDLIFIGTFEGGEAFRAGATFYRGNGKVFYFQPGHETYAVYRNEHVIKVMNNAVKWLAGK